MSEEDVIAALGRWDEKTPDTGQGVSALEYDALANNPLNDALVLQISFKEGKLVNATLRANNGYLCECPNSFRGLALDTQCEKDWAASCLTLLDPPAKTCAAADWSVRTETDGKRRIDLIFEPVERQPANAEEWSRLVEWRIEGYGTVHLAWQPDGWRVQSACIKRSLGDLASRLPARDMRHEVSEAFGLTESAGTETARPAPSAEHL